MFAVVEVAGQQIKVEEKSKYYVPKLDEKIDSKITFENVLLIEDDKKTKLGAPFVKGAKVSATVLEHLKDEKVIVFKKKRRTGYQKSNGHRQQLTRIEVTKIGTGTVAKPKKETKAVDKKVEVKETKMIKAKKESKETE